jgi:hypothetical protein
VVAFSLPKFKKRKGDKSSQQEDIRVREFFKQGAHWLSDLEPISTGLSYKAEMNQ